MRERWAELVHRRLAEAGYRSGGAREAVIELLANRGGCLTPREIVEQLQDDRRRVGAASVYRALATLRELELVRAYDQGGGVLRYELEDPEHSWHHHLVCDRCGANAAFKDEQLDAAIAALATPQGFRVVAHQILLFGLCAECASHNS